MSLIQRLQLQRLEEAPVLRNAKRVPVHKVKDGEGNLDAREGVI